MMKFTPSPTKIVKVINKEGGEKLVPMNRARRRKLKIGGNHARGDR